MSLSKIESQSTGSRNKAMVEVRTYEQGVPSEIKKIVPVEILLGDKNVSIRRTLSEKLGTKFNRYATGNEVSVEIRCNQDEETIKLALERAKQIATLEIKAWRKAMENAVERMQRKLDD